MVKTRKAVNQWQYRLYSSSDHNESNSTSLKLAVMAFSGKTVNSAANDVDFQSCIFLHRVQWVQQGLLAFMAFVHQWLDGCHSLPCINRIIISTSSPNLFFSTSNFLSPTDASLLLSYVFLHICWFSRETELITSLSWAMIVHLASEINPTISCPDACETFCSWQCLCCGLFDHSMSQRKQWLEAELSCCLESGCCGQGGKCTAGCSWVWTCSQPLLLQFWCFAGSAEIGF